MATPNFDQAARDLVTVSDVANSPNPTTVTRDGETIPTLRGALADISAAAGLAYTSKPAMDAVPGTKIGQAARVTEGVDKGLYIWDGSDWVETDDPLGGVDELRTEVDQHSVDLTFKADKVDLDIEGIGGGVVDRQNNLTWLQYDSQNGGVTPAVRQHLKDELAIPENIVSAVLVDSQDVGGGVVDLNKNLTWLQFRASDGSAPESVILMLRERIGAGGSPGTNYRVHPADGAIVPAAADLINWATWGSSSSWYLAPLANTIAAAKYEANIFNGGVSGQGVESICARMGSHSAQIAFPDNTIPASGSVNVTSPNVNFYRFIDYFGVIGGVAGRIRRTTTADDPLVFTRTTAGDEVTLSGPEEFIPDEGISHRPSMSLLWMGKNDTLESGSTPAIVQKVVEYTNEAFDWLAPLNIRALVLGHFINRNIAAVSEVRNQINQINAAYQKRYGPLYIDVQGWLMSPQVWTDLGISPTSQDLADQAAGVIPESLARDDAHLTDAAYTGIFNHLIVPRIEETLGWFSS